MGKGTGTAIGEGAAAATGTGSAGSRGNAAAEAADARARPSRPGLFEGAKKDIGYVVKASILVLLFWSVQFLYMYLAAVPGQLERSIILASSYSGATLIAIALMIGPIAVLWPKRNYIRHRRTFGVWGFTLIISHVIWVLIYYQFTLQSFLSDLDPFTNAIIFGALAFICYTPMYITSTDWAVSRLGFKNWKTIHRIVYVAFLLSTLHFIRITYLNNTTLIWNYSKLLLMAAAALAYVLELAAYVKYMRRRRSWGSIIYGGALIVIGAAAIYVALTMAPA